LKEYERERNEEKEFKKRGRETWKGREKKKTKIIYCFPPLLK